MIFEYSVQKTFTESIDIVDYYILIKTILGKTHIIEFGPVAPDIPSLCDGFNISYKKIDYKEAAIFKEISKYINDFKKEITFVEEVTDIEVWQQFPTIQQYYENI